MKKITKKQKLIIYSVLGAAFLVGGGKYFVSGLYGRLTGLGQKIKIAEKQLRKGLTVQENKEKISEDYKKYSLYFQMVDKNEQQIFSELLKEVERLVHAIKGTVVSLAPQDVPEVYKTYKEYKASFRVEMGFPQLLEFLTQVQESEQLLKFEKLTVTAQGDQGTVLRVEGTLGLAVPL